MEYLVPPTRHPDAGASFKELGEPVQIKLATQEVFGGKRLSNIPINNIL